MQNFSTIFSAAATDFAKTYPRDGALYQQAEECLSATEPEALFALVLLRRVQQKRTGTQAPLCREMLGLETKAAAFPELSLMQQWWHRCSDTCPEQKNNCFCIACIYFVLYERQELSKNKQNGNIKKVRRFSFL